MAITVTIGKIHFEVDGGAEGTPVTTTIFGKPMIVEDPTAQIELGYVVDEETYNAYIVKWRRLANDTRYFRSVIVDATPAPEPEPEPEAKLKMSTIWSAEKTLSDLFRPYIHGRSQRMLDTMLRIVNLEKAKKYVTSYFEVQNAPCFTTNQSDKNVTRNIESSEFETSWRVLHDFYKKVRPPRVNKRFDLYFGGVGSGKTTHIIHLYPDSPVILANYGTTPVEMVKLPKFEEIKDENEREKAIGSFIVYVKTKLVECMEKGIPLIIDEINKYPQECFVFLQEVLDNKTEFFAEAFGETIHIADGFKVIGSMNLYNEKGNPMALNMAMVDRASRLIEYEVDDYEMCVRMFGDAFLQLENDLPADVTNVKEPEWGWELDDEEPETQGENA